MEIPIRTGPDNFRRRFEYLIYGGAGVDMNVQVWHELSSTLSGFFPAVSFDKGIAPDEVIL